MQAPGGFATLQPGSVCAVDTARYEISAELMGFWNPLSVQCRSEDPVGTGSGGGRGFCFESAPLPKTAGQNKEAEPQRMAYEDPPGTRKTQLLVGDSLPTGWTRVTEVTTCHAGHCYNCSD